MQVKWGASTEAIRSFLWKEIKKFENEFQGGDWWNALAQFGPNLIGGGCARIVSPCPEPAGSWENTKRLHRSTVFEIATKLYWLVLEIWNFAGRGAQPYALWVEIFKGAGIFRKKVWLHKKGSFYTSISPPKTWFCSFALVLLDKKVEILQGGGSSALLCV